jgi:hypothetical protein
VLLNVVGDSSEKSVKAQVTVETQVTVKTQVAGRIAAATRGLSPLFLRVAHSLSHLVERIAPFAQSRPIDRRLRTLRWCDSTERALLADRTGL